VDVSSSDTNEALELLTLGSGHNDSPRLAPNDARVTSSESNTGREWFEDLPQPNDIAASVYVALTVEPSPLRQDRGQSSRRSHGRSCVHAPKTASVTGGQQLTRRRSAGQKPRDQSFASRKPLSCEASWPEIFDEWVTEPEIGRGEEVAGRRGL
jgi:hypothetical protein